MKSKELDLEKSVKINMNMIKELTAATTANIFS